MLSAEKVRLLAKLGDDSKDLSPLLDLILEKVPPVAVEARR
jgi:hypothetical protein